MGDNNMSKLKNIKKVMVIGSGPIVIGQGAEFDYSGTQACSALRDEGIESVLLNSNPATIMTDSDTADNVYIEPMTVESAKKIIEKERPDGIIAGLGGQTGLNLTVALDEAGILDAYNVKVLGTSIESIKNGEDRELFRSFMAKINEPVIQSEIVETLDKGIEVARNLGYPVVLRPAYTLGGTGGGIVDDEDMLKEKLALGLKLSPVTQVLVEKSIYGWKEVEYEVMRDAAGSKICVCNMENIDPVGIHTGDSIVVAPSQTLSDKEYQLLRTSALKIIDEIGIIGGCNVQFALNPNSFEYAVIEINPRVSRSSALASKATGYPIAKVSAKLALGYRLEEIINDVTKKTFACFEPSLDYVVTKIPKWPFEKFEGVSNALGTKMTATGEIMSIGRTLEESLMKGIRSLELKRHTLRDKNLESKDILELREMVKTPYDERIFALGELIRRKYSMARLYELTQIDLFFLNKFREIVAVEGAIEEKGLQGIDRDMMIRIKEMGLSDRGISQLANCEIEEVYALRKAYKIERSYLAVDTCAGEFEAETPYYYSTFNEESDTKKTSGKKVVVVGSGPIMIGQGIEFDYASVHCIRALKKLGYEAIIVNNNPETVSTDFNEADKLYFEPITPEDVHSIVEEEQADGVIIQFGGQTSIKLSKFLQEKGIKVFGTDEAGIRRSEDRDEFNALLENIGVPQPKGQCVYNAEEGVKAGNDLGYPLVVRPSYVLGGRGMEITYDEKHLKRYLDSGFKRDKKNPILLDKYLVGKEIEIDAVFDGQDILIPGIMEHIERSGVHSGDSMTAYPAISLTEDDKENILQIAKRIAKGIGVLGIFNIQFIQHDGEMYVIEVNPRASRTVPYISKVTGLPIVELATRVSLGESLNQLGYGTGLYKEPEIKSVKMPVFSTQKLENAEISLGPEMKSTGEVLGIGTTYKEAFYKGFIASGTNFNFPQKSYLATVKDQDKVEFLEVAKRLDVLGFKAYATSGTCSYLKENGIAAEEVQKLSGNENTIDTLIGQDKVDFIINTPTAGYNAKKDGFRIRRLAIERGMSIFTSLDTAKTYVQVFEEGGHEESFDPINLNKIIF
jgi:carbamoyl-phosphate synthase large subunit